MYFSVYEKSIGKRIRKHRNIPWRFFPAGTHNTACVFVKMSSNNNKNIFIFVCRFMPFGVVCASAHTRLV